MDSTKPDILLIPNFYSDHVVLFETLLSSVLWDTTMAARQTASFGEPYNYSQMAYPATPMHSALKPVATALFHKLGISFNNCLLNYYTTGQSTMGFHSDETKDLQPSTGAAIISLGYPRDITYKHKIDHDNQHSFTLTPGSLLYMDGAVQDNWLHGIKKQKNAGSRISVTWRAFRKAS